MGSPKKNATAAKIRPFIPRDAEFCCKVRSSAFITEFREELGPENVATCVNAFMPEDFVGLAKKCLFYIVERNGAKLGFFSVRRISRVEAEVPLIYLERESRSVGIGSMCIRFIEQMIISEWKGVATLFVDTVVPKYNGGFYLKMGFKRSEDVLCRYPQGPVAAVRFIKALDYETAG